MHSSRITHRNTCSRSLAFGFAALLVASGCAETAKLTTEPEGARLYVNGIYVGETPVMYTYRSGLPERYFVRVEKEGYLEIKDALIERQYRADVSLALLLLGIFPYFFSARLEDQLRFVLQESVAAND